MGIQFIPGYREATSPTALPSSESTAVRLDDLKKKVNRPVPELPIADDSASEINVTPTSAGRPGAQSVVAAAQARAVSNLLTSTFQNQGDAPSCPICGHIAVRNGACYKCLNCGESLGCS